MQTVSADYDRDGMHLCLNLTPDELVNRVETISDVTADELRSSTLPDACLKRAWIGFSSQLGNEYQAVYCDDGLETYAVSNMLILSSPQKDRKDFRGIAGLLKKLSRGGRMFPSLSDEPAMDGILEGLRSEMPYRRGLTHETVADIADQIEDHFGNSRVEKLIYENVPRILYESPGFDPSKLVDHFVFR